MGLLKKIWNFLLFLDSLSTEERERKEREEQAAYHYIWAMRQREKERTLVIEKKEELLDLIRKGGVEPESGKMLLKEIELKERLLSSKVMEIERTKYNAWIIEGFEKELAERKSIILARVELERFEQEGKIEPNQAKALRQELQNKENIMDKMAERLPTFPVDLP